MKEISVTCSCDNCDGPMTENEYDNAIKVTLRVDLPNPKGGCGQCNGTILHICNSCAEKIGIINSDDYHKYTYSQGLLGKTVENCKKKILSLFFDKT